MFALKKTQRQQQQNKQQVTQRQAQQRQFSPARRTGSGSSISSHLNVLDLANSGSAKVLGRGSDRPAQAGQRNGVPNLSPDNRDSNTQASSFNALGILQQSQQLKAKLNHFQFGWGGDWQQSVNKFIRATSRGATRASRSTSSSAATNLPDGPGVARTSFRKSAAASRQRSACTATPTQKKLVQTESVQTGCLASMRRSASLKARTRQQIPATLSADQNQSLVRKSSAQLLQLAKSPTQNATNKRADWNSKLLKQVTSSAASELKRTSGGCDLLASMLDKSNSTKSQQINKSSSTTTAATTPARRNSIVSLLSSAASGRRQKRCWVAHRMSPSLASSARLLFVAALQLLVLVLALTGSGLMVDSAPVIQLSPTHAARPIRLAGGPMSVSDSSLLDAIAVPPPDEMAGTYADLAQVLLGELQVRAPQSDAGWDGAAAAAASTRQHAHNPEVDRKLDKPEELFWIERRRLNRDRALEPPAWLRTRPIRAGEPASAREAASSPALDKQAVASRKLAGRRLGRGRQLRESRSELYDEILRQLLEGALSGRALLDDLYEDSESRSKSQVQRGAGLEASPTLMLSSPAGGANLAGAQSSSVLSKSGFMKLDGPSGLVVAQSKGQPAGGKQDETLLVAGDEISDSDDVTSVEPTGVGDNPAPQQANARAKPLLAAAQKLTLMDNKNKLQDSPLAPAQRPLLDEQQRQQYDRLRQSAPSTAGESRDSLDTSESESGEDAPADQQQGTSATSAGGEPFGLPLLRLLNGRLLLEQPPQQQRQQQLLEPLTPQEDSFHVVEDIDQADNSQEVPVLVVGGGPSASDDAGQQQLQPAAGVSLDSGLEKRAIESGRAEQVGLSVTGAAQAQEQGSELESEFEADNSVEDNESESQVAGQQASAPAPMKREPALGLARYLAATQMQSPIQTGDPLAREDYEFSSLKAQSQLDTAIKLIKSGLFPKRQLAELANRLKSYLEGALGLRRGAIDGLFPVNSQQLLVELDLNQLSASDSRRLAERFDYAQDSNKLLLSWIPGARGSQANKLDNPLALLVAILGAMDEDELEYSPSGALQPEEPTGRRQFNELPPLRRRVARPSNVVGQWNLDAAANKLEGEPDDEQAAETSTSLDDDDLVPPPNYTDRRVTQRRKAQFSNEAPASPFFDSQLGTLPATFSGGTQLDGQPLGTRALPTSGAGNNDDVDQQQWPSQTPTVYSYQPASFGRPSWRLVDGNHQTLRRPAVGYYTAPVMVTQQQQQQQQRQLPLAALASYLSAIYGWNALQHQQQHEQPYLSREHLDILAILGQHFALVGEFNRQLADQEVELSLGQQQDVSANTTRHRSRLFDVLSLRHENIRASVWFQLTAILLALFGSFLIVKLVLKKIDKSRVAIRRMSNLTSFSSSSFRSKARLWLPFSSHQTNPTTKESGAGHRLEEGRSSSIIKGETVAAPEKLQGLGEAAGLSKRGLSADSGLDTIDGHYPNSDKIRKNFDLLAQRLASFLNSTSKGEPDDLSPPPPPPPSFSAQAPLELNTREDGAERRATGEQQQFRSSTSYIRSLIEALTKTASAQISGANQSDYNPNGEDANEGEEGEGDDEQDELLSRSASRTGRMCKNGNRPNQPTNKQRLFVEDEDEVLMSQMDISAAHLILDYMEKHLVDKERLRREWLELNAGKPSNSLNKANQLVLQRLARVALNEENLHKNRNPNVVPFDRNRVRLGAARNEQSPTGSATGRTGRRNKSLPSDYINASFIHDDDPRRPTHIIAQGPTQQTSCQFWQIVWEQEISVIVMLTRLNENGRQMCHCYWPTSVAGKQAAATRGEPSEVSPTSSSAAGAGAPRRGSVTSVFNGSVSQAAAAAHHASPRASHGKSLGGTFVAGAELDDNVLYFEVKTPAGAGQTSQSSMDECDDDGGRPAAIVGIKTQAHPSTIKLEVHLISEHVSSSDYLVRNMYLINRTSGETRTISQFHYLAWQDGRTPENVRSFLQFRRKVHKSYRNLASPILVHCNDGAGRSGTYTLIDIILERIKNGAKEIDLKATLEHLRDQRVGLCETQSQFEFVLVALAEEIQIILNALPR